MAERSPLSRALRAERRRLRLTQEELASAVDVSSSYIARIELGSRNPSDDVLERLVEQLGAPHLSTLAREAPDDHGPGSDADPEAELDSTVREWKTSQPKNPVDRGEILDEVDDFTRPHAELVPVLLEVSQGPLVMAVTCGSGHQSPAYATVCRICGDDLHDGAPLPVRRPALGVLHSSEGQQLELVGGVLVGRKPDVSRDVLGELPALLTLSNPMVSRNHLQIVISDWTVFVRDLGSGNGTVLERPGQEPVPLPPRVFRILLPDDRLQVAREVTLEYRLRSSG
jgi:transcriptional regulator with XRE-family HTH domain